MLLLFLVYPQLICEHPVGRFTDLFTSITQYLAGYLRCSDSGLYKKEGCGVLFTGRYLMMVMVVIHALGERASRSPTPFAGQDMEPTPS